MVIFNVILFLEALIFGCFKGDFLNHCLIYNLHGMAAVN